jgi:hypothetical protein
MACVDPRCERLRPSDRLILVLMLGCWLSNTGARTPSDNLYCKNLPQDWTEQVGLMLLLRPTARLHWGLQAMLRQHCNGLLCRT